MAKSKKTSPVINKNSRTTPQVLKKKNPFWFYIIAILIPVAFFVILELSLRLFNYGQNIEQWVKVTDQHYMLNPDIAYRYFYTTKNIPYSSKDIFYIKKRPNTFRLFVLGESSAAGFPSGPSGTFPRYIQKRLKLMYPNTNIEVVNVSMAAINTYTLLDLLPGIIEQKPDLVLFYTGHNEYYGALGVGSTESLGAYRSIVNLMLKLNKYKTVELLRNTIKYVVGVFSSSDEQKGGTLMARMAKEQYIPYKSSVYELGVNQFEGNMRDMLNLLKENNIPVILGNLTSNLRDQKPFISDDKNSAINTFKKATELLEKGDSVTAKRLFIKAKDLDLLRFRASEDINNTIFKLGKDFGYPVINVDSAFCAISRYGITGDELMTDHLHPTVSGYNYLGKLFFEQMIKSNLLPKEKSSISDPIEQDRETVNNLIFTRLDSTISRYRITILKADWPYTDKPLTTTQVVMQFDVKDYIDSLSLYVIDDKLTWENSHRKAATYYLNKGKIADFRKEMDALIDIFPIITDYYSVAYSQLMQAKAFSDSYYYLKKEYDINPNVFNTKWLGIIDLSQDRVDSAIKYLEESLGFNSSDLQVLYNISGAYAKKKQYKKAFNYINRCVSINPNFPGAQILYAQLKQLAK